MTQPKKSPQPQAESRAPQPGEWFPLCDMEVAADAEFLVRASKKGRPVKIRFRKTRAYDHAAMRFMPFLKMIDAATGLKLTFTPIEFSLVPKAVESEAAA